MGKTDYRIGVLSVYSALFSDVIHVFKVKERERKIYGFLCDVQKRFKKNPCASCWVDMEHAMAAYQYFKHNPSIDPRTDTRL